ncbi:MAG TPA: 1,4-dihydroxy-2-naphthoate polyprenyltransferase [Myxococcaceae bacterium]|nr:1,4-dihydroxy-2-naphthoate polyprenyltransferase [Myxococcaceae bacterium]
MTPSADAAARAPSAAPTGLRIWVAAARPRTLTASAVPVAVGSAVAAQLGAFRAGPAAAAMAGALFIQIGTNLVNDYADFKRGADTPDRLGPPRATAQGWVTAQSVLKGAMLCFAAAAVLGAYLIAEGGWPILAIGLTSLAAGWAYTAGPYPLAYHGLGDAFVFVFFGLVSVLGTVWVEAGRLTPLAWVAAVPVGALATALLVVNNLRDIPTDARVGKRTLAVRLGPRLTRAEYVLLLLMAFAAPPLMVLFLQAPMASLWALAALPLAVTPVRTVLTSHGTALNAALAGTARLQLAFGGLLTAGLWLGR